MWAAVDLTAEEERVEPVCCGSLLGFADWVHDLAHLGVEGGA